MKLQKFLDAFSQESLIIELSNNFKLDRKIIGFLLSRGFDSYEKIEKFLNPKLTDINNPYLFKNMENAVLRIKKAIENRERILIYGDYDVDGISATAIMIKTIRALGYNCNYFLPNRFIDGYGLSNESILKIKEKYSPDLIITVDCGISNKEEIEFAKSLSIDFIVTDHHELPQSLPDCIVINPKQAGDYPFSDLCGAGVAYKLACALLDNKNTDELLTIAMIATIADIVPLINENRAIVYYGLKALKDFCPIGIKKFLKENKMDFINITASDIAYKISPKLNASGRMGEANDSLLLYLEENPSKIKKLIEKINSHNIARQELCNLVFDECDEMLKTKNLSKEKCIILSSPNWDSGILGIIASRLVDAYNRPVFLFSQVNDELKGSGRSIDQINIHDMLVSAGDLIEKYGGHSMAAGLTLKPENFDKFIKKINQYIKENINDKIFEQVIYYDIEITNKDLTQKLCESLNKLEPFGCMNPKPLFMAHVESVNILPLKNFPMHANLIINKNINLISFNYKDNIRNLAYFNESIILFDVQNCNDKGEVKGIAKYTYSNHSIKNILKNYIDANYLFQLTFLGRAQTINYFTYPANMLANFIHGCSSSIYGTLFVANNFETYNNFITKYDISNINDHFIFEINMTGGANAIVVSPSSIKNFNNFTKIIFLDPPLDSSYLAEINEISDASIYIPNNKNFNTELFKKIQIERNQIGIVFEAIKKVENKNFLSLIKLFQAVKRESKSQFNYETFIFCILVFTQLNILIIEQRRDDLKIIITKNQSSLNNSNIYNFVKLLKQTLN